MAGRALHRRLRRLLERFATYHPPPVSLNNLTSQTVHPLPDGLLSDHLVERIVTETLFTGSVILEDDHIQHMEVDIDAADPEVGKLDAVRERFANASSATNLSFPFPTTAPSRFGPGRLEIPGWIRERAAEVLFEGDDQEEVDSIQECILHTILKVSHILLVSERSLISAPRRPENFSFQRNISDGRYSVVTRIHTSSADRTEKRPLAFTYHHLDIYTPASYPRTTQVGNATMAKEEPRTVQRALWSCRQDCHSQRPFTPLWRWLYYSS